MNIQEQARVFGDPNRHRILRYVVDADGPVDVAELTAHLGLHHNAIRQHLAKLVEAGLLTRDTHTPGTPGRPRLIFRVDPAADGRWGLADPYQRLSLILVEMVATGSAPEEAGRRAGQALPVRSPETEEDRISVLQEAIAAGGFDPVVEDHGETVEYVLGNCPFVDAAEADPETVCSLHLGLAQGLVDQLDGVTVTDLIPHDPHRGGCRLRLQLVSPHNERAPDA